MTTRAKSTATPLLQAESLKDDLLWGALEIANFLGKSERQVVYLLERRSIPAGKVAGRWCASRKMLRQFFERQLGLDAA